MEKRIEHEIQSCASKPDISCFGLSCWLLVGNRGMAQLTIFTLNPKTLYRDPFCLSLLATSKRNPSLLGCI